MLFDKNNPDKELVRQVLYQVYNSGQRVSDIWGDSWCLDEFTIEDYDNLINYMLDEGFIVESVEPNYYKITEKGLDPDDE